jgi:endo-1,4-beta-xylanase
MHWDATIDEAAGAGAKTWTLHVGDSFADVPSSHPFYAFIETIFHNGITGGCGGGNYCPANNVTRAQMAVLLLKTLLGPAYVPPVVSQIFADVPPGSFAFDWINDLFNRGVTGGCGGGNYCPTFPNTRGQMAVFLTRTFGLLLYGP